MRRRMSAISAAVLLGLLGSASGSAGAASRGVARRRPARRTSARSVGTSSSATGTTPTRSAPSPPCADLVYDGTGTCFADNIFATEFPTGITEQFPYGDSE